MRQASGSSREPRVGVSETWEYLMQSGGVRFVSFCPTSRRGLVNLLPMACNPHPATGAAHPVTCDPNCRWPWTDYPAAGHPDIVGSCPSPVAARPNVSRSRCHCLGFNPNGWRGSGHDDLASWAGCCHLLRRRSRCYRRWFFRAANQCQGN
jgi:hypothetical protein